MLSRLTSEARQLMLLDNAFKALLPAGIASLCRAVRIHQDELVVFADSGIVAGRLRMIGPGLLPQLAQKGYVAAKIRVKVNVNLPRPAKRKSIFISEDALDNMAQAAETISNPIVRHALARLVAHQKKPR